MVSGLQPFHFGSWLRGQLKRKGTSIRSFASALPVSAATVQTWMASAAPEIQPHNVGRLSRHLGIKVQDLEWLLASATSGKSALIMTAEMASRGARIVDLDLDAGATPPPQTIEPVSLRQVPFFDVKIPASGWVDSGEARTVDEADGWTAVAGDVPKDAFALRIFGDCMEPEFPSGAVIVFVPVRPGDHGAQFEPGKAYYFEHSDGKATFKKVFYEPPKQRYRLEPVNPKHNPIYVPEQMLGRLSRAIHMVVKIR